MWFVPFPIGSALCTLAFWDVDPLGVAIVDTATLVMLALSYVIVADSTFVSGDDPLVEQYVDNRLRATRFMFVIVAASGPPFLFTILTEVAYPRSLPHVIAALLCDVFFIGAMIVQWRTIMRGIADDRKARWWQTAA